MKYRKKPVVIEAKQVPSNITKPSSGPLGLGVTFTLTDEIKQLTEWCGGHCKIKDFRLAIVIPTLEGDMCAGEGDFIIKGVAGEFYPCKSEIFHKTYEVAE